MKQVFRRLLACIKVMLIGVTGYCQANITAAEYFFDADPGYGSGTPITISTPGTNIASLGFNANVASLTNGMHTLFIRTKNANGTWSNTNISHFAKVQLPGANPNTISNIAQAEYFFDTDPGIGNGTSISLGSGTNISSVVFNASVSTLANGVHTLYVRTRDATGWSITSRLPFVKMQPLGANPHTISNIVQAEYFYDNDPGAGNGAPISITPGTTVSTIANLDVSGLPAGVHTLYVRTKDALGQWSMTGRIHFAKVQAPGSNPNTLSVIDKAEYFYNTDPGIGNGTNIPLTAAADINGAIINADVSALPTGLHVLYIRTRDAQGKWSITSRMQFTRIQGVSANPHVLSRINKAEYFYDNDPGFGNGQDIPIGPSFDVSSMVFQADVSVLTQGMHTLYVRCRDSLGQWSELNRLTFVKVQPPGTNPNLLTNIEKAEYFYNTDPGYGGGTDIPVVAGTDMSGLVFNANVSSLPNGVHTLYVRTRDAEGKWSEVNNVVFARVQSLGTNPHSVSNVSYIEYFIDTDPGFGNALSLSFTPATDVNGLSFNVDMTVLVNGPHTLYVRSRDLQGNWSITNIHSFNGGTAPLSIELLSFEALLLEQRKVMLQWVTETEHSVGKYTIERSHDAQTWVYVGEEIPLTPSSAERRIYKLLDDEPGTGIVYYRLTETDLSGRKTHAPIRQVVIGSHAAASTVFPNPGTGKTVNIQSSLFTEGSVTVTIIGADGKLHWKRDLNDLSSDIVTISDLRLPPGNYFINLQNKNKTESLKLQVTGNAF